VTSTILVVEDDDAVRLLLRLLLEDEGYRVAEARRGDEALDALAAADPDVVLLDLRLPGLSGFEVCHGIRRRSGVPVIIVTAYDDTHDVVAGLEAGADDYVTKPFVEKELLARIRVQLRRAHGAVGGDVLRAGDIELRVREGVVLRAGQPVSLTRTEHRLLHHLLSHPNVLLSRRDLLRDVWGYAGGGDERLVDTQIRRLRAKVEPDPSEPSLIVTVRGLGYRLCR
jgi:DNA-binding response OmpR family regulator